MQPKPYGSTICAAKTKQGTICQNEGNKTNGRCYLHGGNSTGAKTAIGKLNSSQNARKKQTKWFLGVPTKHDIKLINQALNTAILLVDLVRKDSKVSSEKLLAIVEKNLIALEVMKFVILERLGAKVFIIAQSALDFFYQDTKANHLEYHKFFCHYSSPYFPRSITLSQEEYIDELTEKSATRAMKKLDSMV